MQIVPEQNKMFRNKIKNFWKIEIIPKLNKMFRNKIKIILKIEIFFETNKNVLEKILSKYNQVWSSFEDLIIKNRTVQSKYNLNNSFVR